MDTEAEIDCWRRNVWVSGGKKEDMILQPGISEGYVGQLADLKQLQRQTVVSQFFQLDRLVVEGGKTGKQKGNEGGIVRQKDTGWVNTESMLARNIEC